LKQFVAHAEGAGVARSRIVLLGFSQGACLTSEFALRHASRFGALIVFTGGLIGPPGTEWAHPGNFAGTPVFFGSGDPDAHVPVTRVVESAEVFTRMGADVKTSIYPGRGHWVGDEEVEIARTMLDRLTTPA
jgi:predicted esterase